MITLRQPCVLLLSVLCLNSLILGMPSSEPGTSPADDQPGCQHEGRFYALNDFYKPDPCHFCQCIAIGNMYCIHGDCATEFPCYAPVKKPGACCHTCPEVDPSLTCNYKGKVYPNGVKVADNNCEISFCVDGEIEYKMYVPCPPKMCYDAVMYEGDCCETCPNGYNCGAPDGSILQPGTTTTLANGDVCFCPEHPWDQMSCETPSRKK